MSCIYKLAVIIRNPSNDEEEEEEEEEEFLIVKQERPPKFGNEEYDSYIDPHLWDFPCVQLQQLPSQPQTQQLLQIPELYNSINITNFDFALALNQVSEQVGIDKLVQGRWVFWKYVEEPEFGPGSPIHTIYITANFDLDHTILGDSRQWMSWAKCSLWLSEVTQDSYRIGPLVANGFQHDSRYSKLNIPPNLRFQEYPFGVMLVPMRSRTGKPFSTTNLIVIAPETGPVNDCNADFVARGDALIVDPGCNFRFHDQLAGIIAALPRKLIVFVTHHHPDHVDGLSVIQKCNPDAILLAHENTMQRIGKDDWSLGYTSVAGGEEINIGSQQLQIIFAPGHTDGHMGLLHTNTRSLIVGDHCVGQGSAVLDAYSGGNIADYFDTTYKFLDLSPYTLIPMHGRVNMWPKHFLCQYLKNRRDRETSVLKAVENGGTTLFDIVSTIYKDVDRGLWFVAASNVRLHVEHLAQQNRLPEGFSLENFNRSIAAFGDDMSKL